MHQFFGDQLAYNLFNTMAFYVLLIISLFFFKSKSKSLGLWSKLLVTVVSDFNSVLGKLVKYFMASFECVLLALTLSFSTFFNMSFGEIVGTGGNYFATLILAPILWCLVSVVLAANPMKQIDIATMFAPIYLFVVKLACFFHGCCWGIPWEYGPYNHHPDHPGNQVPVQAIEAFFALAIFAFLLIYRRKAKTGTIFPMYLILYGGTRFFSEFFTAAYPDVFGPFNMYQILCVSAVLIGLLMLFIVRKFGEKISDFFEKPHRRMEAKYEHKKAEEKAKAEAEMKERLEKAKAARAKAKAAKR